MEIGWKDQERHKFRYNGDMVERKGYYCDTPIGQFKVFESVGGNLFYSYPSIREEKSGYLYTRINKIKCSTFEEGIKKCEEIWNNFKEQVNRV